MSELPASIWPEVPGYEILSELGRGGMGVVFKARRRDSQVIVALKVLRDAEFASDIDRARFRIEAEAATRMRHPHVVQLLDVGEHAGRPWFAMEFVDGGSLDKHLAGRPQPPRLAAEAMHAVATAVQHAHEERIVHRDLKPANILLARVSVADDPDETRTDALSGFHPKITDFGLAKRLDSDSTVFTRDGAILGTASYMSPEQAAGRAREVGPAADIYAIGAILFELLSGRPPFQGGSWNETVQKVLHDEPPSLCGLQPDVPAELEAVCLKCLEKDPAQRYTTARELAEDLARFLDGEPVTARGLSEAERHSRFAAKDGYAIVGEIGRGPRSVVYQAQAGPLKQLVALKVFSQAIARDEWESWLERGAGEWTALAHARIVPLQRTGWWDGVPYVAFEHVPGGSLATRLQRERPSLKQALELVAQIADVVAFLHRQGVVHGNLKPANILLAPDGTPRLTDLRLTGGQFLAARERAQSDPQSAAYLAPEVLIDETSEPRPNTDTYGLGLLLYELVTGRPPFKGSTAAEVLEQVRSQLPTRPSEIRTGIPRELDAVCLRCLKKDPWHRFPRAHDVANRMQWLIDSLQKAPTLDR